MTSQPLTFLRILAVGFVLLGATAAWFVLGSALVLRTGQTNDRLSAAVGQNWGAPIVQTQPEAWYLSPSGDGGRRLLLPAASRIDVQLHYEPKSKGLMWYRTYGVRFRAEYRIANPTPITQTVYVQFRLPGGGSELEGVVFELGEPGRNVAPSAPVNGCLTQAISIPAGESVPLEVAYRTRGCDDWRYDFGAAARIRDFQLTMTTNFAEIDFPAGTSSPSERARTAAGWSLSWRYGDVISPHNVGVAMPGVLNAGPVAARISFFAPVSLVFFFAVLLILGAVQGVNLHPMNYFFLAAGCFAFQLLFAYLVDVLPVHASFALAAAVSLVLVSGYLHLVGGRCLSLVALPAQFAYMVLFSYSFFFEGLSGLTIAVGAVVTLAILMVASARVDWSGKFRRRPRVAGAATAV
jgi:hypothetical protein